MVAPSFPADGTVNYGFVFRGTTGEYFKIWLVNVLLTMLTLGVFSAWAKVRSKRYFYANTFLDGANFEYHANPLSILAARIILLALLAGGGYWAGEDLVRGAAHSTLLAFLLPWAVVRGFAFNARYSSYRNVRFSFDKKYGHMYLVFAPVICLSVAPAYYLYFIALEDASQASMQAAALTATAVVAVLWLVVLFLLMPPLLRVYHAFKAENHALGDCRFTFNKPPLIKYWAVLALSILLFGCLAFMVAVSGWTLARVFAVISNAGFVAVAVSVVGVYFSFLLAYLAAGVMLFFLFWNNLAFAGGGFRCSATFWQFLLKIQAVNTLAIVLSLGLLYPWAKIRKARFLAEHMQIFTPPGLLNSITGGDGTEAALGEELDAIQGFDFDVGLI